MKPLFKPAAALAAAALALSLAGCAGSSIEGTYSGTSGHTLLLLNSGGTCGYTAGDYNSYSGYTESDDLQVEVEEDCSWSLSGSNLTLIGVSRHGSLTAFVGDDGAISIPDQHRWNGEIYSKK